MSFIQNGNQTYLLKNAWGVFEKAATTCAVRIDVLLVLAPRFHLSDTDFGCAMHNVW